jgi:hypothetical protein
MRRAIAVVAVLMTLLMLPAGAAAVTPGDEPSTAIPVSAGTAQFDSTAMTSGTQDPTSCGDFEDFTNTMWFSYTPTRSAMTMFDINSFVSEDQNFLAILFVYKVETGGSLTQVGCSAYPATVFTSVDAGATYLIVSAALDAEDTGEPELSGHGGLFDLTITPVRGRVLMDRFHATDSFVDEFLSEVCGFEVTVSYDDRGIAKTFFDAAGVRRFTFFVVGSTTFSTADSSVTFSYAQPFQDDLIGQITFLGIPVKVVVDGEIVSLDDGRLVVTYDGEIVFDAGSHTTFGEGTDICGLLAG